MKLEQTMGTFVGVFLGRLVTIPSQRISCIPALPIPDRPKQINKQTNKQTNKQQQQIADR